MFPTCKKNQHVRTIHSNVCATELRACLEQHRFADAAGWFSSFILKPQNSPELTWRVIYHIQFGIFYFSLEYDLYRVFHLIIRRLLLLILLQFVY